MGAYGGLTANGMTPIEYPLTGWAGIPVVKSFLVINPTVPQGVLLQITAQGTKQY